jgi:hypothetical protein
MKRILVLIIMVWSILPSGLAQEKESYGPRLHLRGIVMDANSSLPLQGTQIMINHQFSGVSAEHGTFGINVERKDTVSFNHLGYKSTLWLVADTLIGNDFVAGIYMNSDTISIGEVIILPRFLNLKSQILNSPSKVPATMANARYNVAISAYQGKTTTGRLGDPDANYQMIHRNQSVAAYEKGGIPSSAIAGINPLILIPAAYLLLHGMPEKPGAFEDKPSQKEIDQIRKEYFRLQQQK